MNKTTKGLTVKDQFGNKINMHFDVRHKTLQLSMRDTLQEFCIETNEQVKKLVKALSLFDGRLNEEEVDWNKIIEEEFSDIQNEINQVFPKADIKKITELK